ncbi:MAG: hypothetical protein EBX40_00850 [Gammaproteobacteria bacterium]|nr:hypothetical protein [Gammaproteobacteria bacterium]
MATDQKKSGLELVLLRNDFYKDGFRRLLLICLVSLLLNLILILTLLFGSFHKPKAIFFTAANDGKVVYGEPLNNPMLEDTQILAWVNQNVPQLFDVDFLNYRRQLEDVRPYFTDYGWQQFITALTPTMQEILKQKYTVHAKPSDVPFIMSKGVVNGIYTWQVQVPLEITYALGPKLLVKTVTWTLILQRTNNNAYGQTLGIAQIVQTK